MVRRLIGYDAICLQADLGHVEAILQRSSIKEKSLPRSLQGKGNKCPAISSYCAKIIV